MSIETLRPLKTSLLDAYGHFSDQRIKKIDSGQLFIVDDRSEKDRGADGKLFNWFCQIFVEVLEPDLVQVILRGGIPGSTAVTKWIKDVGAQNEHGGLLFTAMPDELTKLSTLAKHFRSIVRPGARYSVKAYKYVCPRTASSLERLREVLAKHWSKAAAS